MKQFFLMVIGFIVANAQLSIFQLNKRGSNLTTSFCNKNSLINIAFSASSQVTCTSATSCSNTQLQLSKMTFLNVQGNIQSYTLLNVQLENSIFNQYSDSTIIFTFTATGQTIYLIIPYSTTIKAGTQSLYITNFVFPSNISLLNALQGINFKNQVNLTAFNFLNDLDYGTFYTATNNAVTQTFLFNTKVYYLPNANIFGSTSLSPTKFPLSKSDTKNYDRLCWASSIAGIFETHIRQSIPLWFIWLSLLIFWSYVMISNQNAQACTELHYRNNKWTSWALYSMFHLAHQRYFSKISRTSLFYVNIIWQCCVLSAIYSTVGFGSHLIIILWAALIAVVAGMPLPYILGKVFLQNIYKIDLQSMQIEGKKPEQLNKAVNMQMEKDILRLDRQKIGYEYGYYSILLAIFTVTSIMSVSLMIVSFDKYQLHYNWLASIAVTLVLEHLILDPILTCCFGLSSFYQSKGYFYNQDLAEAFKIIK